MNQEEVQDIIGAMITGNVEVGIAVTYDDDIHKLDFNSTGVDTFLGLTDTPASYAGEAGKYPQVNGGEDALEFATPTTTFTALTDTPASYTDHSYDTLRVNSGETALEFVSLSLTNWNHLAAMNQDVSMGSEVSFSSILVDGTLYIKGINAYTKLLLHLDGNDGATTTTDSSYYNHTITMHADAQLDTAQKKFGATSLLLDGTGDKVTIADSDDFFFDTGDFTVDFWVRGASWTAPDTDRSFYEQYVDVNNLFRFFYIEAINYLVFSVISSGTHLAGYTVSWTPATDTWYHLALVRSGSTVYFFIDGVSQSLSEVYAIGSNSMPNLAVDPAIGYSQECGGYVDGWIDEFRISKGIARWTSNFTPPVTVYSVSGNLEVEDNLTVGGSIAVGTLTLTDGSITDSSGSIDFGDENLSTTGTIGCGAITSTGNIVAQGGTLTSGVNDTALGLLYLYGSGSGGWGGVAYHYLGADHDVTLSYYMLSVYEDDFRIGTDIIGDFLKIEAGTALCIGGNVGIGTTAAEILHTYVAGLGNKQGLRMSRATGGVGDLLTLMFRQEDLTGDEIGAIDVIPTSGSEAKMEFRGRDSNALTAAILSLDGASLVSTFAGNLIIPDAGNLGSASDPDAMQIAANGNVTLTQALFINNMKSGANQAGAGAAANELWETASHATLPDHVVMMGV